MSDAGAARSHPIVDRSAVFDVLPSAFVVLTPELIVVDANDAYLRSTGRERDDLLGVHFLTAFPPPVDSLGPDGRSELQVSLELVRDTGLSDTLPVQKYPIADASGVLRERHWLAIHVPVFDVEGRVSLIVQRTEDITEFSMERERVAALAESSDQVAEVTNRARRVEAELFVRARELADAIAAKDEAARQVTALADVAIALAAAHTLTEVEDIVVGRGVSVLGADGGAVVSVGADGGPVGARHAHHRRRRQSLGGEPAPRRRRKNSVVRTAPARCVRDQLRIRLVAPGLPVHENPRLHPCTGAPIGR